PTDIRALLHVNDPDTNQVETWSQSVAPANGTLTFSGATAAGGSADIAPGGSITYAPATNYIGADSFVVQVSDGAGATALRTIAVTVNPPTGITSSLYATGMYGSVFSYAITASNNPTGFGAAGLPTGLSVDTTNGTITGTPLLAGNFAVTLSSTNQTSTGSAQLNLNILPVNLTVSGILASNKVYDGNNRAGLNFAAAQLQGLVNNDSLTLNISNVVATFTNANVGNGKPVSITGLSLLGAMAGNYTLNSPTAQADITPARGRVILHRSVQLYDGTAKSVTATSLPLGLPVAVTYNGSGAPSAMGAYTVIGTLTNPNYAGAATNYLYIVNAPQFTSAITNGGYIHFTWTTWPQVNYQVEATPALAPFTWSDFGGPVNATNSTTSLEDLIQVNQVSRFYRVRVILE
ncbi:MAG TPA: YDG domain-containing protein, partial [Verrucomicrobiae bacterium]